MEAKKATIIVNHSDEEMLTLLNNRYPAQGFTGSYDSIKQVEKQVLTFATVYDLAKQGRFEDIRPDILIPHFKNLVEVYHHRLATLSEPGGSQNE